MEVNGESKDHPNNVPIHLWEEVIFNISRMKIQVLKFSLNSTNISQYFTTLYVKEMSRPIRKPAL